MRNPHAWTPSGRQAVLRKRRASATSRSRPPPICAALTLTVTKPRSGSRCGWLTPCRSSMAKGVRPDLQGLGRRDEPQPPPGVRKIRPPHLRAVARLLRPHVREPELVHVSAPHAKPRASVAVGVGFLPAPRPYHVQAESSALSRPCIPTTGITGRSPRGSTRASTVTSPVAPRPHSAAARSSPPRAHPGRTRGGRSPRHAPPAPPASRPPPAPLLPTPRTSSAIRVPRPLSVGCPPEVQRQRTRQQFAAVRRVARERPRRAVESHGEPLARHGPSARSPRRTSGG